MTKPSGMATTPAPGAPEEHGTRLRNNALNLLGAGIVIMVCARATNSSGYFATRREVFQPSPPPPARRTAS